MRYLIVLSVVVAASLAAATASSSVGEAPVCASYLNVPREVLPQASRDGRVLVWARTDFRNPTAVVYVSAPDGSRARRVLPRRIVVDWTAISPDGSEVLIGTHDRSVSFGILASASTTTARTVLVGEVREIRRRWRTPEWSPDGRFLVEARSDGVWVTSADDGSHRRVSELPWSWAAAWSPDGTRIAFTSGEPAGVRDIYVVGADGSGLHRVTRTGTASAPAWSPDGRWIAFSDDLSIYHGGSAIAVVRPDGSDLRRLTRPGEGPDRRSASDVSWVDATRLVFVSLERRQGRRKVVGLHTIDVDGRNERRLTYHCHVGTPASDTLLGSILADTMRSLAGADEVIPGPGRDDVDSGPGADLIRARDRERDSLSCGAGRDTVLADRNDRVRGCERVLRR